MNALFNFLNENLLYIAIIIIIIVSLLVYINLNNIDLNKIPTKKLTQTVTVETFNNLNSNLDQATQVIDFSGPNSFCETHQGNSPSLNLACKGLTDENCSSIPCCVLVQGQNGNKCMAGGVNGPTFKKDTNGNLISMDTYYYEGKLYTGAPTSV
jgi:hypothetical protein